MMFSGLAKKLVVSKISDKLDSASTSEKHHALARAKDNIVVIIGRSMVRFLQFVLAVTVAGMYGSRIQAEHQAGGHASSQWTFAVVVGGIAAITAVVYQLPLVKSHIFFAWDCILFILWIAVFGTFAQIYIHRPNDVASEFEGTHTQFMKNAVWVDLVNLLLWFITAIYGGIKFLQSRKGGIPMATGIAEA